MQFLLRKVQVLLADVAQDGIRRAARLRGRPGQPPPTATSRAFPVRYARDVDGFDRDRLRSITKAARQGAK